MIRLEQSARSMGTVFSVQLHGDDEALLQKAAAQAFDEVRRLEGMLSNYIASSELSQVNEHAADDPVCVSHELFDLLAVCGTYSRHSEGSFDITVGPLMKIWGFYRGFGTLPSYRDIHLALESVGYEHVELDTADLSVRFRRRGLNLDPGGIGKGYAVDRMVSILRAAGISSGLVSAGGSTIYAIGAPPSEPRGWSIQIREPERGSKSIAEVFLKDASLSTSGSSELFFWHRGKRYSHLLDPRTGFPSQGMLSVSVIARDSLDSEVWAKPFYILGHNWTKLHKSAELRVFMCEDKGTDCCGWLP